MNVALDKAARDVLSAWDHYGTAECLRGWIDIMREALAAAPQGEPVAWVTEDGERAITAKTKAQMVGDGGAGKTSVKPFCVPCYAAPPAPAPQPSADPWRDAVEQMLAITEQVASDDPRKSIHRLIDWYVSVALDPLVSSDARALVQRGRDEVAAQPSAEPELVRAARDAMDAMLVTYTAVRDHAQPMDATSFTQAINALRRALDAINKEQGNG